MTILIAGLLIVVATHSLKMCAPAWRLGMIDSFGPWWWRIGHSVVSLLYVEPARAAVISPCRSKCA
jgi:uncharacterized membrane protein